MVQMKIDFHVHTYHSYDSIMQPEKILRIAKEKGLNGCVICDHNTIKGGIECKKLNTDPNFVVIVAAEIEMAGVIVPVVTLIGAVPVTDVTVPVPVKLMFNNPALAWLQMTAPEAGLSVATIADTFPTGLGVGVGCPGTTVPPNHSFNLALDRGPI